MKRPQKLAVMLVPTPPYEICGLRWVALTSKPVFTPNTVLIITFIHAPAPRM